MSIYTELREAGVLLDNHESDLYAKVTPESEAIIERYVTERSVSTFQSQIDRKLWYEIPFAYDPWWEARAE